MIIRSIHDMKNRHIKTGHMKILVSLLCLGIINLSFLHDHQVSRADEGYENPVSEHAPVVRHFHLGENSPHLPIPKSEEHENKTQWIFLDHVNLTTLASCPSLHLLTPLSIGDGSFSNTPSPFLSQSPWEPTTPVRGSPPSDFNTFSLSLCLPALRSGRAPPLSFF